MAGKFDPVGVSSKRLRKARKTTFERIKKVKAGIRGNIRDAKSTIRMDARIRGDIFNPFN